MHTQTLSQSDSLPRQIDKTDRHWTIERRTVNKTSSSLSPPRLFRSPPRDPELIRNPAILAPPSPPSSRFKPIPGPRLDRPLPCMRLDATAIDRPALVNEQTTPSILCSPTPLHTRVRALTPAAARIRMRNCLLRWTWVCLSPGDEL